MKTSDFYFDLPQELIAQDPLEDRSSSRLSGSQQYESNPGKTLWKQDRNGCKD